MTEADNPVYPIKLLGVIVDRGKGERVVKLYQLRHLPFQFICPGTGTASSEMLDYLGLGTTEKDLVLTLAPAPMIQQLQEAMLDRFQLKRPGRGILFSIPLSSIIGSVSMTVNHLTQKYCREDLDMEQTSRHSMVVAIVNQGFSEQIMETAKAAGAGGGTVINGRGLGSKEAQSFLGISITPEKELVLIIVKNELREPVMRALNSMDGLRTDARGILFSLPVDSLAGIS